jgi:hypothetical protein
VGVGGWGVAVGRIKVAVGSDVAVLVGATLATELAAHPDRTAMRRNVAMITER